MSVNDDESPLSMAAVVMNEVFRTLVKAGFSEVQALRLIAFMLEDLTFNDASAED